mmetsp:Transcript_33694/g.86090  ORF Transcript_33694/g.86090 Transcript_33694/m.86090 type:complete len:243 (+) Transcript_33694:654-1382(+)
MSHALSGGSISITPFGDEQIWDTADRVGDPMIRAVCAGVGPGEMKTGWLAIVLCRRALSSSWDSPSSSSCETSDAGLRRPRQLQHSRVSTTSRAITLASEIRAMTAQKLYTAAGRWPKFISSATSNMVALVACQNATVFSLICSVTEDMSAVPTVRLMGLDEAPSSVGLVAASTGSSATSVGTSSRNMVNSPGGKPVYTESGLSASVSTNEWMSSISRPIGNTTSTPRMTDKPSLEAPYRSI